MKAILIEKDESGQRCDVREVDEARLPEGDVTVRVAWSTLNYKDALAITGSAPVVRTFPMVPGIDLAGIVEHSGSPDYRAGDKVVLNGWGVGETHWGGLAEMARVKSDWLVPLAESFTLRQAMAIGTAGYTAMLCVMALERQGIAPDRGPVIITGAAGGVGSIAVAILSRLGYHVIASTGKAAEHGWLKGLGAREVIDRAELSEPGRPLGKERWAGGVDAVGSHTLANVLAQTAYGGAVAACGLAQDRDLPTTVAPFILRGVSLLGVDSVMAPRTLRLEAWNRLARDLDPAILDGLSEELPFTDVTTTAARMLAGGVRGRLVVPIQPELG